MAYMVAAAERDERLQDDTWTEADEAEWLVTWAGYELEVEEGE
jgi:hypothetical protein